MRVRKATKEERARILKYYQANTGDDYDNLRIGVFDGYITDGPGYCGKLFFIVGGYENAYCLLKEVFVDGVKEPAFVSVAQEAVMI